MSLMPFASPVIVVALTVAERIRAPGKTDWLHNIQAWLISAAVGFSLVPLFTVHGVPSLLRGRDLPLWLAFPLYAVVWDLGEYLYHRAQHRIPLLWAMHSLHHSDPAMSALTTQRHFWGDQLIKSVTVWFAASLVIAPTPAIVSLYLVLSLWNFAVHSSVPFHFGRWSWLLNSSAYHRRHHSRLPEHYDSNFAALFPIWDVIAGSYHRPDGSYPATGLDEAPQSFAEVIAWPLVYRRMSTQSPSDEAETPA
jgi:sterol desaturase/sphingolipid hydroxylase (fatty acid hydroxylase superfamily)